MHRLRRPGEASRRVGQGLLRKGRCFVLSQGSPQVSAIVPAYNEEHTIGGVLDVLLSHPHVDEVVVVSDGSVDRTAEVARSCGATVVELPCNMGKGAAYQAGVRACSADIVLFLDADLIGLTPEHVDALLGPVMGGDAEMAVGVFEKGRTATDLAQIVAPYLSGQRALRRHVFSGLGDLDEVGFAVEVALTRYMKRHRMQIREIALKEMTHHMKEEKQGLTRGFAARMRMYWEIVKFLTD